MEWINWLRNIRKELCLWFFLLCAAIPKGTRIHITKRKHYVRINGELVFWIFSHKVRIHWIATSQSINEFPFEAQFLSFQSVACNSWFESIKSSYKKHSLISSKYLNCEFLMCATQEAKKEKKRKKLGCSSARTIFACSNLKYSQLSTKATTTQINKPTEL